MLELPCVRLNGIEHAKEAGDKQPEEEKTFDADFETNFGTDLLQVELDDSQHTTGVTDDSAMIEGSTSFTDLLDLGDLERDYETDGSEMLYTKSISDMQEEFASSEDPSTYNKSIQEYTKMFHTSNNINAENQNNEFDYETAVEKCAGDFNEINKEIVVLQQKNSIVPIHDNEVSEISLSKSEASKIAYGNGKGLMSAQSLPDYSQTNIVLNSPVETTSFEKNNSIDQKEFSKVATEVRESRSVDAVGSDINHNNHHILPLHTKFYNYGLINSKLEHCSVQNNDITSDHIASTSNNHSRTCFAATEASTIHSVVPITIIPKSVSEIRHHVHSVMKDIVHDKETIVIRPDKQSKISESQNIRKRLRSKVQLHLMHDRCQENSDTTGFIDDFYEWQEFDDTSNG